MTLSHILVPVDFGDASAAAVAIAGRLAAGCGARLTLLHAESVDAPAYFTADQIASLAAERKEREAQATRYLESFGRRHTVTPFAPIVVMRPAVEAIAHLATEADLVVLGTHGRQGVRRWWLGSVAERVLREVSKPVLVTHAADVSPRSFSTLAVHAAPMLSGQKALALARQIGRALDVEVVDHRERSSDVDGMFKDAGMVVVAEPEPHDRLWRTTVGEPLIRTGRGPVLFVPESRA